MGVVTVHTVLDVRSLDVRVACFPPLLFFFFVELDRSTIYYVHVDSPHIRTRTFSVSPGDTRGECFEIELRLLQIGLRQDFFFCNRVTSSR